MCRRGIMSIENELKLIPTRGITQKQIIEVLKQKGLNSLDKAIEAFKGIIPDKTSNITDTYEPRPTYKYFED